MGNLYGNFLHWSHLIRAYFGRWTFLAIILALDVLLIAWIINGMRKNNRNKAN